MKTKKRNSSKKGGPGLLGSLARFPGEVYTGIADTADEVLHLNGTKRKKRKVTKPPTAKQLAARRKFAAMSRKNAAARKRANGGTKKKNRSVKVTVRVKNKAKGNPIRFTESEARRYSGKIKGLSFGGSTASRTTVARKRKTRFKKGPKRALARAFSGSGFLGLGRSRKTIRANTARRRRNAAATRTGIFQPFHGRPSTAVRKFTGSSSVPKDVDTLGGLKELVIKQKGRPQAKRIVFNPSRHALVASRGKPGRFKLNILGPRFKHRSNPGELHDIGEIRHVTYVTRKNHLDNGQLIHYTHALKAPYPRLCVDHEGLPVIHDPKGGRQINARGIID